MTDIDLGAVQQWITHNAKTDPRAQQARGLEVALQVNALEINYGVRQLQSSRGTIQMRRTAYSRCNHVWDLELKSHGKHRCLFCEYDEDQELHVEDHLAECEEALKSLDEKTLEFRERLNLLYREISSVTTGERNGKETHQTKGSEDDGYEARNPLDRSLNRGVPDSGIAGSGSREDAGRTVQPSVCTGSDSTHGSSRLDDSGCAPQGGESQSSHCSDSGSSGSFDAGGCF